jgi:type II secretory pathway pseudopilin PulG
VLLARTFSSRNQGFVYLLLIFALAIMGLLLAGFGQSWQLSRQREKEAELLQIGKEFSRALESYRRATPPGQSGEPASLEDLVADKRFPFPVRHLRRIYRDPFSTQPDWVLERVEGRIVSIASASSRTTLKQSAVLPRYIGVAAGVGSSSRYTDWHFIRPANTEQPQSGNE